MLKFLAYYRVSTQRQGLSGLGMDSQRETVARYVETVGGSVLRAYQEVESGTKADRPELARAVSDARRSKATICIARLDRLSRDAHLIAGLQKMAVPFVCCDMPEADDTMIGIYGYLGQREAKLISARTKAALAQAKIRGVVLGKVENMTQAGRAKGAILAGAANRKKAVEAYADLGPWLAELRAEGLSLREIVAKLDQEEHTTRRGRPWNPTQVSRVLARFT
jgi:DNA invertase Pin-like site-specific DNA recombinase